MEISKEQYNILLNNIGVTIEQARQNAFKVINTSLVQANWEIGRHIVEFEQHGEVRAEYGTDLLSRLSKDLQQRYGKGFGRRNILDMRRFYLLYHKWQAVPAKLSWTHFVILLSVSDEVLVFDNLAGKLIFVVHANPDVENAYAKANARLDELEKKLSNN